MRNLSNHLFTLGKTTFFHQITFRASIDVALHFNVNLVPFCIPKSNQNPSKCRPQEAPDNASIFASLLDPKHLPLGIQLGTILALSFASRRPKRPPRPPPRGLPDRTWSQLGFQSRHKTAQEASQSPPWRLMGSILDGRGSILKVFGSHFLHTFEICGPHFFNNLSLMLKHFLH